VYKHEHAVVSLCEQNKTAMLVAMHHSKTLIRHETVIINRLCIGHTRLTHSYLLSGDDPSNLHLWSLLVQPNIFLAIVILKTRTFGITQQC